MVIGIGWMNACIKAITVKNKGASVAGSIRKPSKSNKKKPKRVPYNFKEISAQILRTKTSSNAGQVVVKARGKVANLRMKLRSGIYDDQELLSAIRHAERILKVAKKRQKHLREEENAAKNGGPCQAELEEEQELDMEEWLSETEFECSDVKMQEYLQELMQQMQEMMEDFTEVEEELLPGDLSDELLETVSVEMDPADLEQLKKKHRQEELRDIMEADMKYLKAVFDRLAREKQEVSNGVSLQLNGVEQPAQLMVSPVSVEGGSTIDEMV